MELKLLKRVLSLQAESLDERSQKDILNWIIQYLNPTDYHYDSYGNLYITKGRGYYPCIVAHVDQVHSIQKEYKIYQYKDTLFAFNGVRQVGTGGDDLCGVFIALQLYKALPNIKLVFFKDEECGCCGSQEAEIDFFKDCSFVIQPDRRHLTKDIITFTNGIKVVSKAFKKALKSIIHPYGFDFNSGSMTDVGELVYNGIGCCGINVSAGYFFAHTEKEIVSISAITESLRVCNAICKQLSYKRWDFTPTLPAYNFSGKWDNWPSIKKDETWRRNCEECGEANSVVDYGDYRYCNSCFEYLQNNPV